MKLKRVKILGFKTFADKAEFDLDGDIIAVVGPNGCGKSNIVDAILWGLGESNARQLRAQTGKEVIFAGSTHRKPIGFCEVSLLFDNEDGALPMDAAQVSITRRLTRGGESDYQINRRTCRLRDINDLLADSGLGRAGYAIVGQSEIDQALAASPQQRRGWIDEAAGVQRYRARRVEALRRLQAAEDHLVRIHDIITEIEHQREPLAAEAEQARQYKSTMASLREVESGLLSKELLSATEEISRLQVVSAEVSRRSEELTVEIRAVEHESLTNQEEIRKGEILLETLRAEQQRLQSDLEQAHAQRQIAEHKLESLAVLAATIDEETSSAEDRRRLAESDLEKAKAQFESEAKAHAELHERLGGVDLETKRLDERLQELELALGKARQVVAVRQRLEVEMAHRQIRLKQIAAELAGIEATLPDLEAALLEAEAEAERLVSGQAALEEAENQIRIRLEDIRRDEDEATKQVRDLLARLAALDGRRRGLEATIEANDGFSQGTRAVLDAASRREIDGEFVPVAAAINVSPDLAHAFDIALGASANDLIVNHDSLAKVAIAFLRDRRAGRTTFQPLNLMRPAPASPELRRILQEKGVVGRASDLVDCLDSHRPVIESLLGRVVIVESLEIALKFAKTSGWSRMVTLDGEVVHSSGAVTGGVSSRQGSGIVQRRSELQDVIDESKELSESVEKARNVVAALAADREQIIAEANKFQERRKEDSSGIDEARAWLLSLRHEHSSTVKSRDKLRAEAESLNAVETEEIDEIDISRVESERDEAMRLLAERTSDAGNVASRLTEAQNRKEAAQVALRDAERRLAHVIELDAHRSQKAENLGPERQKYEKILADAESAHSRFSAAVEAMREEVKAATTAKTEHSLASVHIAERIRAMQTEQASLSETAHHSELKRVRLDSQKSNIVQRLLEEYGIGEDEALAAAPGIEIPADSASVVARLRRELRAMGDVNLGAVEAFERLSARHDELTHQVDDILSGKQEILKSVEELDRLTKDRFESTFVKLQVAFSETFQKVFGGGEGSLELADSANMLDSGVDIQVTVPGKRRQRLELLSGGERALSALAFLFALLKVKPTPLVILDEVDAPLDGRNVERFIQVMRGFSDETQFILITHNPVTIESADVWFGVTMQEPGVSTLVPFKVPERSLVKAVVPDAFLKAEA